MAAMELGDVLAKYGFKQDLDAALDRSPDALQTPEISTRVVSPRNSDPGKKGMPVNKVPALPLNTFNAKGKDKKAQLSPEQVAELRSDISQAMGDIGKGRRKKTAAADAPAVGPVEPSASKKPRAPRGTYARKAAQAVLESLTTAAPKAHASKLSKSKGKSKPGRPVAKSKGKTKSAGSKCFKGPVLKKPAATRAAEKSVKKASAKKPDDDVSEDSVPAAEDLFGSDSEMATTQELPGRDEEESVADPSPGHEGDSGDEGGSEAAGDSNDGGDKRTDRGVSNPSGKGSGADLRSLYWNVVHEEQKKIKKSKPDMPGREVLKLARKAWETHPLRMNAIKNLTKSEASRRRIKMPKA